MDAELLRRINSATKYPSIPTYHEIGKKGRLEEKVAVPFDAHVIVTEKIDGTNARIILLPNLDFIIGSREELLYAQGDRIVNPELGIVEATRGIAKRAAAIGSVFVLYGEVYGGKLSASKQYTGNKTLGFRLFDVAQFPEKQWLTLMSWTPEKLSAWRKNDGQTFMSEQSLRAMAREFGVHLTPRIAGWAPPPGIQETAHWLEDLFPFGTQAALDDGAKKNPEGVVIRTADRSSIAKLRFEDYERTLRGRK